MTALQPERLAAGIAAEARHLMDPAEGPIEQAFMQMACDHPETCVCTTITHHLRVAMLLDTAISQGGEWTTRRVQRFYRAAGIPAPLWATARKDLHALNMQGHLVLHEGDAGRRFYTVNTRKDTTA
ncbi:hypothetical protein [Streptomyces murinus]|uniref:hypothetical protein n=1 Tax=Streptomyces murinus TaxID=33900 RepID=UPI0018F2F793|nr:hypothetical protein [Streptomyces murinus]